MAAAVTMPIESAGLEPVHIRKLLVARCELA